MKRKVIKIIAFLLIFVLSATTFHRIFSFKDHNGGTNLTGIFPLTVFYEQERKSIDVMFFGSSHVYRNINTGILWEEYGMASFDLAASNQPFWNTYYYIKEALKTQHPKVVVVDVFMAGTALEYVNHGLIVKNNYGLKLSKDKISSLKASVPEESWTDYLLEYPTYHNRYTDISKEDFLEYCGMPNGEFFKGFWGVMETAELTQPDVQGISEIEQLPEKSEKYLMKIIELLEKEDISLMLIAAPYCVDSQQQMIFNRVAQIANESSVPFINYNNLHSEIGLDFSTDFSDWSHLNHHGNVKFTRYLADYLKQSYDIPDRRGEEGYDSYNIMAKDCSQKIYNQELKEISDFGTWLEKAQNENYVLVYTVAGDYRSMENYEEVKNVLLSYGLNLEEANGSNAWVMQNRQVIWKSSNEEIFLWHRDMGTVDALMVQSSDSEDSEMPVVNMNRVEYKKVEEGLNIFVYDVFTESLVEAVGFPIVNGRMEYGKR